MAVEITEENRDSIRLAIKNRPKSGRNSLPNKAIQFETLHTEFYSTPGEFGSLSDHINAAWGELTRDHDSWFLGAMKDVKVEHKKGEPYYLYIPPDIPPGSNKKLIEKEVAEISKKLKLKKSQKIEVRALTRNENGYLNPPPKNEHSLLYLPHPYVVSGVRYNEMYNWDTAFVIRGLLEYNHPEKTKMAKDMVDNMLYEIDQYGTILNGNRTYYLDPKCPRSQPPLLSECIKGIYAHYDELGEDAKNGEDKKAWLKRAIESAEKYHKFWMKEPHIEKEAHRDKTPLSVYNSDRITPGDEVETAESGHYDKALQALLEMYKKAEGKHGENLLNRLKDPEACKTIVDSISGEEHYQQRKDLYYIEQFLEFDNAGNPKLTDAFYRGDWAMRESGFDPSRRFGFFNVDIINHIPVCLNSLRHKMETELASLYGTLAEDDPGKADAWKSKQKEWETQSKGTRTAMQRLWDDGENGKRPPGFRDLNISKLAEKYKLPKFRDYDYATALFPLWGGVATQNEAARIATDICPKLIRKNGLNTSTRENTGSQWDYPIVWAPLQIAAMEGLERYGYYEEAWNIGTTFLNMITNEFKRTGKLWEKYNSKDGTSNTSTEVKMGYSINDEGFGWTDSAALAIISSMLPRLLKKMKNEALTEPDIAPAPGIAINEKGYPFPVYLRKPLQFENSR